MNENSMVPTPTGFEPHQEKPRLRGVIHQWAAVVALVAGVVLVSMAATVNHAVAAAIYSLSLLTLFSVSAMYHRINWRPKARLLMRRLDHGAIFVLIAGTYTPIALIALGPGAGTNLFVVSWSCAVVGILKSIFWPGSPKWVTAALAVVAGWCLIPYLGALGQALDGMQLFLFLGGGILYTIGALTYAAKRPNPVVGVFGYHEVFHAFTVVAAAMHFAAIITVIRAA
jgi:hemolysin III